MKFIIIMTLILFCLPYYIYIYVTNYIAGIIAANWKVSPNLKTRRCKFTMKKNIDTIDIHSNKSKSNNNKIKIEYDI